LSGGAVEYREPRVSSPSRQQGDIIKNVSSLGYDLERLTAEKMLASAAFTSSATRSRLRD
jgi:hypothetical protein